MLNFLDWGPVSSPRGNVFRVHGVTQDGEMEGRDGESCREVE